MSERKPSIIGPGADDGVKEFFKDVAHEWADEKRDCSAVAAIQLAAEAIRLLMGWAPKEAAAFMRAHIDACEKMNEMDANEGVTMAQKNAFAMDVILNKLDPLAEELHTAIHSGEMMGDELPDGLGEALVEALSKFFGEDVEIVSAKRMVVGPDGERISPKKDQH